MNRRITARFFLAALMTGGLWSGFAHAQVGVRFSFGTQTPPPTVTVVERHWVPGRWEHRMETFLVEPARHEKVWVPPAWETRHTRRGQPVRVMVREGFWQEIQIPARYETRQTRVWVSGYYQEIAVPSTYVSPQKIMGFSLNFNSSSRRAKFK
jgi:hypothetical protein